VGVGLACHHSDFHCFYMAVGQQRLNGVFENTRFDREEACGARAVLDRESSDRGNAIALMRSKRLKIGDDAASRGRIKFVDGEDNWPGRVGLMNHFVAMSRAPPRAMGGPYENTPRRTIPATAIKSLMRAPGCQTRQAFCGKVDQ
jgi:hypothetical protein